MTTDRVSNAHSLHSVLLLASEYLPNMVPCKFIRISIPDRIVVIKHGGKTYPLVANLAGSGADFKEAVFQVTGVPPGELLHCERRTMLTTRKIA